MTTLHKNLLLDMIEEHEKRTLSDAYLGWVPSEFSDWDDATYEKDRVTWRFYPIELSIHDPSNPSRTARIIMWSAPFIEGVIPLKLFTEGRKRGWTRFAEISTQDKPSERFVIPLH